MRILKVDLFGNFHCVVKMKEIIQGYQKQQTPLMVREVVPYTYSLEFIPCFL